MPRVDRECVTHHHACDCREKKFQDVIDRLRGQLQNCVDHLHMMKRKVHPTRTDALSLDKVIEQANKALYETLDV